MATDVPVLAVIRSGIAFTTVAADVAGNEFTNDGKTIFIVVNSSGAACVATFVSQVATADADPGTAPADQVVTTTGTPAQTKFIGPFEPPGFSDTGGKVQVTYSDVGSVTVSAIKY